jgi:hypothetical protein
LQHDPLCRAIAGRAKQGCGTLAVAGDAEMKRVSRESIDKAIAEQRELTNRLRGHPIDEWAEAGIIIKNLKRMPKSHWQAMISTRISDILERYK